MAVALVTPPPPAQTVVIKGVVSDDAVEGATVIVTSLADNSVLATTLTGTGGAYTTLAIAETKLASGYLVTATGGTSLGKAFVGTLRAVYSAPIDYAVKHVTTPTTAATKAAEDAVADAGSAQELVLEGHVLDLCNSNG